MERLEHVPNEQSEDCLSRMSQSVAMPLCLQLLGGFRVWIGGREIPAEAWRQRKAANLVKLLALAPKHSLHREQVLDVLWPELEAVAAWNNLHYTLTQVRHIFEPGRRPRAISPYLGLESDLEGAWKIVPTGFIDELPTRCRCVALDSDRFLYIDEDDMAVKRGWPKTRALCRPIVMTCDNARYFPSALLINADEVGNASAESG